MWKTERGQFYCSGLASVCPGSVRNRTFGCPRGASLHHPSPAGLRAPVDHVHGAGPHRVTHCVRGVRGSFAAGPPRGSSLRARAGKFPEVVVSLKHAAQASPGCPRCLSRQESMADVQTKNLPAKILRGDKCVGLPSYLRASPLVSKT